VATSEGTTRIWDLAPRSRERLLLATHGRGRWDLAFSRDGRRLATIGPEGIGIWDAETGRPRLTYPAGNQPPSTPDFVHLAFSPDGARLAAAAFSGDSALVLDTRTGRRIRALPGPPAADLAFSRDGTRLATAGLGGAVRLWDSHTGAQLGTVTQAGTPIQGVVFSPDGRLLASLAEDGTIRIDVVPLGDLIALARQRVTRGFTNDECLRYLHQDRCPDR
jgi:WD40 repeat protein